MAQTFQLHVQTRATKPHAHLQLNACLQCVQNKLESWHASHAVTWGCSMKTPLNIATTAVGSPTPANRPI